MAFTISEKTTMPISAPVTVAPLKKAPVTVAPVTVAPLKIVPLKKPGHRPQNLAG